MCPPLWPRTNRGCIRLATLFIYKFPYYYFESENTITIKQIYKYIKENYIVPDEEPSRQLAQISLADDLIDWSSWDSILSQSPDNHHGSSSLSNSMIINLTDSCNEPETAQKNQSGVDRSTTLKAAPRGQKSMHKHKKPRMCLWLYNQDGNHHMIQI